MAIRAGQTVTEADVKTEIARLREDWRSEGGGLGTGGGNREPVVIIPSNRGNL